MTVEKVKEVFRISQPMFLYQHPHNPARTIIRTVAPPMDTTHISHPGSLPYIIPEPLQSIVESVEGIHTFPPLRRHSIKSRTPLLRY